jgi:AbrB family looped-hinge helix DNA binding protein
LLLTSYPQPLLPSYAVGYLGMKVLVTISSKNKITIPKAARNKLSIEPGDQLILEVERDSLILKPRPKTYTKHLRGLHRLVWRKVDAVQFVRKERDTWKIGSSQ